MTFPTIPTAAAGRVVTSLSAQSTNPRTFPNLNGLTGDAAGNLLIAIIAAYQSASPASANAAFSGWASGWTEFVDQSTLSTIAIGAAYKWSSGSETGAMTVTQAATITGHAAMMILSIPGAHDTTPPEGGLIVNGTTAAADPLSLDPAGWGAEDTLWIAVGASGMTSGTGAWTGVASAPTDYSDYADTATPDNSTIGQVELAVAFRQLNASSEDAVGFSVDLSNARNSALMIAVRPSPVAPANLPLETAAALSAATIALTAATEVPLAAAAATSTATLALTVPLTTGIGLVQLGPLSQPDAGTQTLRIRARASSGAGILRTTLYDSDGTTVRGTADFTLTGSFQTFELTPSGVTDWSALQVGFEGRSDTALTAEVSWIELQIPQSTAVGGQIPLNPSAATSTATLALTAPTEVPLAASTAVSTATLTVTAQGEAVVPLASSTATADATLALTAQTTVPLGAAAATSSATLALTAKTTIPLGTSAAVSSATLAPSAPTRVPLATSTAQSAATLSLTAQTYVLPGASAGVSTTSIVLTAGVGVIPLGASTATSNTTLALRAQTQVPLQTSAATSSGTLTVSTPTQTFIPLEAAAAQASPALALSATTRVLLGSSTAASTALLTVFAPSPAPVPLDAATATSTASLALVPLGDRWPPSTGTPWPVTASNRWDVTPATNW